MGPFLPCYTAKISNRPSQHFRLLANPHETVVAGWSVHELRMGSSNKKKKEKKKDFQVCSLGYLTMLRNPALNRS